MKNISFNVFWTSKLHDLQKMDGETLSKWLFIFKQLEKCQKEYCPYNIRVFADVPYFPHTRFFISDAFFRLSVSVAYLFHELSFKCCLGVANIYKHHNDTLFIFTIFVFMSRPRSIYVVSMWSIFLFLLHFHYD